MSKLTRLSLSIDALLYQKLEELVKRSGYTNRSEFIRDLIRDLIVKEKWKANEEVVGTITLVYDHSSRLLSEKLTDLQHDHYHCILATTHVHLDHDTCVEMILLKGRAKEVQKISDLLKQQKGVLHASLSISGTGKQLK